MFLVCVFFSDGLQSVGLYSHGRKSTSHQLAVGSLELCLHGDVRHGTKLGTSGAPSSGFPKRKQQNYFFPKKGYITSFGV